MKINRKIAFCVAAAVMAGLHGKAFAGFDAKDRAALRVAAEEVQVRLKSAGALDGKAITVLPVKGDRDGYFERLVVGALVGAGKTCVIDNDEKKDARFRKILGEIKWDEKQKTLRSVDPATIDELGKLKSTQVFLECRVDVFPGAKGKSRIVEADLMAYAIETKQYVWTAIVNSSNAPSAPRAEESPVAAANNNAIRVRVTLVEGSDAKIAAIETLTSICNELAAAGYVVNGAKAPDAIVKIGCYKTVFDQTGDWIRYKGAIGAQVTVCGENPRHLKAKNVFATGARGLGETDAERNLAAKISANMAEWAKGALSLADLGIRVTTVTLKTGKVSSAGDLVIQREFFNAAKAAEGVRSVELVSQDSNTGTFMFRVVFDSAKFGDGFLNEMVSTHPGWEFSLAK